ncbi:hypothetical protein HNY73_005360 [Argiope bruennichi]|uniref:Uncharacterized protein n=1 Tax=Argiope bruennichi TaxID=94029 RepID=A0A8T0FG89_ARGBR|nr:hypothetical protein HNY73_005360 [Argiope bruennichi]
MCSSDTVHGAQSIVLQACSSGFFALLYSNFKAAYLRDGSGGKEYLAGFSSQWDCLILSKWNALVCFILDTLGDFIYLTCFESFKFRN